MCIVLESCAKRSKKSGIVIYVPTTRGQVIAVYAKPSLKGVRRVNGRPAKWIIIRRTRKTLHDVIAEGHEIANSVEEAIERIKKLMRC